MKLWLYPKESDAAREDSNATKFENGAIVTPINESGAAEENSNAIEFDNDVVVEGNFGDDTKDVAKKPDSEMVNPSCSTKTATILFARGHRPHQSS
jgi:hypothetical protein